MDKPNKRSFFDLKVFCPCKGCVICKRKMSNIVKMKLKFFATGRTYVINPFVTFSFSSSTVSMWSPMWHIMSHGKFFSW